MALRVNGVSTKIISLLNKTLTIRIMLGIACCALAWGMTCLVLRKNSANHPIIQDFPSTDSLLQAKSKKQLILTGAARFNTKAKAGLAFLEENKLIYTDLSPEVSKERSLARFLKGSSRIDKRLLGDFLSKPENLGVLKEYISLFDFKDVYIPFPRSQLMCWPFLHLETGSRGNARNAWGLPIAWGGAANIPYNGNFRRDVLRSGAWFVVICIRQIHNLPLFPAEIKSEDAIYVLAYSIILLNTDQHNPQIRVSGTY